MTAETFEDLQKLIVERGDGIAVVTINRPKVLNALNGQTLDELRRVVLALRRAEDVRCVIITGAGEKSFIAGADINELSVQSPVSGRDHAMRGQHILDLIENMGKPVIAAINGFALGGGCELAMACTLRIAADTARLGQPEINLGIIPGGGGTQRLTRLVGEGKAMELILTGDMIDAQHAYNLGLVNLVVPAADLEAKTLEMANRIAEKSPVALRMAKEAVKTAARANLDEGLRREIDLFALTFSSQDKDEGVRAFLEKRKPDFKGI
jgi:enoyl-CoA hydratase